MRVLLLGATGKIGGRTAAELLRRPKVRQLTLAGRNETRLKELQERLDGATTATLRSEAFDIHSSNDLVSHMSEHDVVASCAGPAYALEELCVEGALAAGTPYISLNDDLDAAKAAEALIAGAGDPVRILSGCGADPGISNMLAALAASQLEHVDEIEIAVGASTRDPAGFATELHFVNMLTRAARSGRISGARSPHPVYFPEPVGWIETFACGHPEELAFRPHVAGGATVGFRVGLAEKAVMDVIRASIATRVTSTETSKRSWLKLTRPLRPVLEQLTPGEGGWTSIRVDVHGRAGEKARTVSYGVVDRLVNLSCVALVEGVARLLDEPKGPSGPPEEVFDPKAFLRGLSGRGVSFARLEPQPL